MKSHNWEQRIGVQNEGKKQKIIGIKSKQQQNKIYELKVKSRNLEWKLDTQKIKVGVMNAKVWIRNEGTKECMSFCIIIIMHVNKLANTKHNKTNVRNTTTTNKQEWELEKEH